jgi:hypothetical protein
MGIGTLTPLSLEEAKALEQDLEQLRQNVNVQYVFGNNLMICLLMFIPIIGPLFGFWVSYNTGVVIAAESTTLGMSPILILLSLLIFPFAWLEFLSYSVALAESVWIIRRAVQGRGRREIKNAAILISICAVMLLAAAIIEMAIIQAASG